LKEEIIPQIDFIPKVEGMENVLLAFDKTTRLRKHWVRKSREFLYLARSLRGVPGCYIFTNSSNKVVYVGASKNLGGRIVDSYKACYKFKQEALWIKYGITKTVSDAFVFEPFFISKFKPEQNGALKYSDDVTIKIFGSIKFSKKIQCGIKMKYNCKIVDNIQVGDIVTGYSIKGVFFIAKYPHTNLRPKAMAKVTLTKGGIVTYDSEGNKYFDIKMVSSGYTLLPEMIK